MKLIERHDFTCSVQRFVEHGLRHASFVVAIGASSPDKTFAEEKLERNNVLLGHGTVELSGLLSSRIIFSVREKATAKTVATLKFRCHDKRADLVC